MIKREIEPQKSKLKLFVLSGALISILASISIPPAGTSKVETQPISPMVTPESSGPRLSQ